MIPQQLNYSTIRPKGWYSKFKQWPIQPMSSNMYWNPNQILRFQLQLTNGMLDPYRSHFQFTVQSPPINNFPVGGLQVDNSAYGLVSQMVLSSNNIEIQRITQYDTLAAYLIDVGFSDIVCARRQWQGFGYSNYQEGLNHNMGVYAHSLANTPYQNGGATPSLYVQTQIPGLFSPTKQPVAVQYTVGNQVNDAYDDNGSSAASYSSAHVSAFNYLNYTTPFMAQPSQSALATTGRFMNIRSQYSSDNIADYVDFTHTTLSVSPNLPVGVIPSNWKTGATMPNGLNYTPVYKDTARVNTGPISNQVPLVGQIFGYKVPVNPKFSVGCNQPMISPTIPQAKFAYGKVLSSPLPIATRTFNLPLLSSVIGILIPADQFLLIPLKVLYNTLIQLTLNPYAMFSTGYCDVHQFDAIGSKVQQSRNFRISQVFYNLHIYQWPQQQMQAYITQSIAKQIVVTSSSWMLSAQYQIPNGQAVRSNWAISTSSQSLAQVVVIFLSNQYLKYSFCRKQFRLSNNIRSMQLKFNTQYYPPQPIVGNAGNPNVLDTTGDNGPYMQQILISNNYMFVTNTPQPRINSYNFAINSRCYDPSVQGSLYDPAMIGMSGGYTWGYNSVNGDTAMGQPWYHQNRYVGRAAFVYSFQPYAHSKGYMVGVDARTARPFDIIFDASTTNFFPSDETMYVFTRSNVVNVYSQKGVRTIGR